MTWVAAQLVEPSTQFISSSAYSLILIVVSLFIFLSRFSKVYYIVQAFEKTPCLLCL